MSLVNVINKVLKSDKNYNISKLGDNGVEFSAPGLYMGNFVLYDCEKNFIFLQGSRAEFKEDVTNLSWEEIAEAIIFKLDWRKRIGAIIYQPDDEKKEVQDGLGNYFAEVTVTKWDIDPHKKIKEGIMKVINPKDVLWKQFGVNLMYNGGWFRKTTYQPNQDNYFTSTDFYIKDENESLGSITISKNPSELKPYGEIIAQYQSKGYSQSSLFKILLKSPSGTRVSHISQDITYIIEPNGKNYFLFKLSK